jgi:DNA-binding NtrC family response regulator
VSISVPGLRDRAEDIPELAHYFLKEAADETGAVVAGITDSAMTILANYQWPGNIRQLRNTIRTMVVMCDRKELDVQDIPPEIHQLRQLAAGSRVPGGLAGVPLEELEKQAIIDTLARTQGNREQAAKILGIGERTLYRKIKEYNL